MQRPIRLAAALVPLVLTAALAAPVACAGNTLDVTIINRQTGERLTPYRYHGRLYVAGAPGDSYSVELANRRGERLLAVVAVDGVNVLTGQTAATGQSGYVLAPWQRYGINGWRKSTDEVAQFVFTALPDSYAARTGRPDNVGVIGVAVYRERPPAVALPDVAPERSAPRPFSGGGPSASRSESGEAAARDTLGSKAQSAPEAPASAGSAGDAGTSARHDAALAREESRRLGTGHGEREHSPVRFTDFVRAGDRPDEMLTIYYDSRRNLIARGIIRPPKVAEPVPFPAGSGFVPDPRG